MKKVEEILKDFEETCKYLGFSNDYPDEDTIKQAFENYHQAKLKLLGISGVVNSKIMKDYKYLYKTRENEEYTMVVAHANIEVAKRWFKDVFGEGSEILKLIEVK